MKEENIALPKPIEPEKYERDWKSIRGMNVGQLLEMSLIRQPYWARLAEQELKRQESKKEKLPDRLMAGFALAISLLAIWVALARG